MFNRKSKDESKKNNTSLSSDREVSLSEHVRAEKLVRIIGEVDKPFLILVLILVGIGIIAVASASYSYAEMTQGDSYFFTKKHVMFALVGVFSMIGTSFIDYRTYKKLNKWIFAFAIFLCLLILTPLKHTSGGATRWINLGFTTFQPSEVLKFAVVVACATYAADAKEKIKGFKCIFFFGGLLGISVGILAIQPHVSCMIIICMLIACMMIMGGVRWAYIIGCGLLAGGVGVVGINLFPHALSRLQVWFNPFDPLYFKNDGWQPAQSLFAIASGGTWGVGLGQSNQKDGYIPEPQNDYIFSVICEEMGFVGAVAIMIIFAALIWRGLYIAKKAPTVFSGLLVAGITCQIGIQTLLNIAVVSNTLPSTGISLPFLSYGGTSLLILLFQMGVILSVSRHSIVEQG
jgi:cell division protein FtsW